MICNKPGDRSVPQNPNVRWGHVFVSVQRLCGSFFLIRFSSALLFCTLNCSVFKPALCIFHFSVCPSVPETLNLWGQSRSQVRSSGTGLHSVSTSYKNRGIFVAKILHDDNLFHQKVVCFNVSFGILCLKHKKTLRWYSFLLALMYLNLQLCVSSACWQFQYVYLSCHDQEEEEEDPSCSTDTLRGPTLLAGFVLKPSRGGQ